MPWFLRPSVVDEMEAQTIMDDMRADGIALTRDQARELARAKLGPPRYWLDPDQVPPPLTADQLDAMRKVRDEHTLPLGQRDHSRCRHAANESCDAPAPGEGAGIPGQQHASSADDPDTAPENSLSGKSNILDTDDSAGLEQGQRGRATRKQQRRFRSVSYVAPNDDDDAWSPFS